MNRSRLLAALLALAPAARGQNAAPAVGAAAEAPAPPSMEQKWNFHVQNTDVVQGYPGFASRYSGPNSLPSSGGGETRETVGLDLMAGLRLWSGAEAHIDALMWQGFGLDNTFGVEGFPSGEAYRLGTKDPNGAISRLFLRQTFGFGGEQEDVPDGQLTLAGKQDVSRLTLTIGRISVADIFDTNAYANSPHTQFMNWALVNNEAWDYPADVIGYDSGVAVELNQQKWTLRYGIYEAPRIQNGLAGEDRILKWPYDPSAEGPSESEPLSKGWAMVLEYERRYSIDDHPGAVRPLAYANRADMAGYSAATGILQSQGAGADISPAQAYRIKYGFGLNWEQEVAKNLGVFSRLGWNDGQEQGWMFNDVAYTATLGASVKGTGWGRPDDTFGLAGILNGASSIEQKFLEAGGLGILAGDGNLNYGLEKIVETYYSYALCKHVYTTADYQFVEDPAFNRDRGPVSVLGFRLHWEL
jgi:high affinity Mn2+ porin